MTLVLAHPCPYTPGPYTHVQADCPLFSSLYVYISKILQVEVTTQNACFHWYDTELAIGDYGMGNG